MIKHFKGLLLHFKHHPYQLGDRFYSPGKSFCYRVVGPVCRLYDREQLPWPSCSLAWRGKQPSWRRIGRRFVPDVATQGRPSYAVVLDDCPEQQPFVMTLFWQRLTPEQKDWWYTKRPANISAVVLSNTVEFSRGQSLQAR